MNNIIKRKWNQNSMVIIEDLQGMAFQAESGGHTFQISGIDSEGNAVALSGTPAGVMLRSDGQDVTLTCSVSGGVVSATLPANAYSVPGRFGLTIFLTSDGQKTAIYAAVGTVGKTSSGTVAPPAGSDVVTLVNQINTAIAAIPANYNACFAPAYSTSGLYSVGQYVTYNGNLYRCNTAITTAETWTAAHWTQTNLGADVYDLKSAIVNDERQTIQIIANKAWDDSANYPKRVTASGYYACQDVITFYEDAKFETNALSTVTITFIYYNEAKEKLGTANTYSSIPSTAKYFVFYARHNSLTSAKYYRFAPYNETVKDIANIKDDLKILHQNITIKQNSAWDDSTTNPTPVSVTNYARCNEEILYASDGKLVTDSTGVLKFIAYDSNNEKIGAYDYYEDIPSTAKYFVFYKTASGTLTSAEYMRFIPASYLYKINNDIEDTNQVINILKSKAWNDSTTLPTRINADGYKACESVIEYYDNAKLETDASGTLSFICYDKDKSKISVETDYSNFPSNTRYFVFYANASVSLTCAYYHTPIDRNDVIRSVYKTKNAADYGFLPINSATDNTNALQNAINGGNVKIVISVPGTYDLNDTVYIDDNTEIVFEKGVTINKSANYRYVFVNRQASTRRWTNKNITIKGLHITGLSHEDYSANIEDYTSMYGMRGHLSFLNASNIKIYDFVTEDLGNVQYAIQFNLCTNFIVDGIKVFGGKDAVHISSSNRFIVKNGIFRTGDDYIALNASDWTSSNCVDGDIYDGVIENIIVLSGTLGYFRALVGAWVDWYNGIHVRRSEIVMNNGNLYRVYAPVGDTEFTSQTEPTNTDFNAVQSDAGGFTWILMQKSVPGKYSTNIWNVSIRNIVNYSTRQTFNLQTYRRDYMYARTLSPDVAVEDYPKIDLDIANVSTPGGGNPFTSYDGDYFNNRIRVNGMDELHHAPGIPTKIAEDGITKWFSLRNIDFTKNEDQYDLVTNSGSTIYVNDCLYNENIKGNILGRIVSNCVFSSLPSEGETGDMVQTSSGRYIYSQGNWSQLN